MLVKGVLDLRQFNLVLINKVKRPHEGDIAGQETKRPCYSDVYASQTQSRQEISSTTPKYDPVKDTIDRSLLIISKLSSENNSSYWSSETNYPDGTKKGKSKQI